MAWALVNIEVVPLVVGSWVNEGLMQQYVTQEINAVIGTICNLITYDGTSTYTPPAGYKLEQVPDNVIIGDTGY